MKEYNKLTRELLAQGYTADNHPDYVYVGSYAFSDDPLDNFDGGFRYYGWYAYERTYKTPCGMLCKGQFAHAGLNWMGVEWSYENDNPYILCPKDCCMCQQREEPFRTDGTGILKRSCVVHATDEEWKYEGSCEAERHLMDEEIARRKISFELERQGRVCPIHSRYNKDAEKWEFNYDPMQCVAGYCAAQQSSFKDGTLCPVLNRPISNAKGNVFYDIKYSGRDYSKDGTLFEGERFTSIIKGRPLFDKPIKLDIAKLIAKLCQDQIRWKVRWNTRDFDALTLFRAERGEIDLQWEVLNIRAEKKETRDFEQDLEDIENGIQVTHELDTEKAKKEAKAKRRNDALAKKIKKLEKKIIEHGYGELSYSDQRAIDKLLSQERIDDLEIEREQNKHMVVPVQMSLFD